MREAALLAGSAMIVKRPESLDTKFLIMKSTCRAACRQDLVLGQRIRASRIMAKRYLDVNALEVSVTLLRAFEFLQASSELHRRVAEREQAGIRASPP
eukprot:1597749-Pyramimonas_sp.AAC.1